MRKIKYALLLIFLFSIAIHPQNKNDKPIFTFMVVTDIQYKDAANAGSRHYRQSLGKLKECVQKADSIKPDFIVHLGDFIDGNFASYDSVLAIWNKLTIPKYLVMGNHDYNVEDKYKLRIYSKLGLDKIPNGKAYYDFTDKNWHFIVLNGNDMSYQSVMPDTKDSEILEKFKSQLKQKSKALAWTGGLSSTQLNWLDDLLTQADNKKENVIVLCHFPLFPELISSIWNDYDVVNILNKHKSVAAYFAGHVHAGDFEKKNNIYYVTFKGALEDDTNAFALVSIYSDKIEIKGFGREPDRLLKLNKK